MARIIVDENSCIGSGECVAVDPEAMEIDASGCAHVLIPEMDEDRAARICASCPVGALSVHA